ncbi:MAG: PASTA domain-containing protein, partial [Aeromicrobium sp.]
KLTSVEAAAKLAQSGLKVKTHDINAAGFKAGIVATQSEEPGSDVDKNSVVDIGVATGFVNIPKSLIGKSYEDAAKILEKLGLVPQRQDQPSDKEDGTVTDVDPAKRARPGDTVVLIVASNFSDDGKKDEKKDDQGKGKGAAKPAPEPTVPVEPTATEPTPTATEPPPAGGVVDGTTPAGS